jgi:GTPase
MAAMLHDRARIHVQAGAGGDGSAGFRREAHVPRGGPDGGDGGRGGHVVLVCTDSLRDLQGFTRKAHHRAARGGNGEGSLRHGADGQALEIRVPPGTQVRGAEGDVAGGEEGGSASPGEGGSASPGEGGSASPREGGSTGRREGDLGNGERSDLAGRRWELLRDGQRVLVARGGSGGRGNKRFATSTRQAPRFAERGLPGEEGWLELRLKLLADVGLVGLPNAGKSSLLARLTRAAPKVASYPFTTLEPNLGVLESDERQLVLADIPGLIEGASHGAGLGHEFLAHVERTRLLVHVLDLAPELSGGEDSDALANHATIEQELAAHDPRLASLPRVLALSKADLVPAERVAQAVAQWSERLGSDVPVIATSAATGVGLAELAGELLRRVPASAAAPARIAEERPGSAVTDATIALGPAEAASALSASSGASELGDGELAEHMVFRPVAKEGFSVEQTGPGAFAVRGRSVERLLQRFDVDNEDAMAHVEGRLRRLGVIQALEAKGFQPGDEIEIGGVLLELDPMG